jgi:hypothetical protein
MLKQLYKVHILVQYLRYLCYVQKSVPSPRRFVSLRMALFSTTRCLSEIRQVGSTYALWCHILYFAQPEFNESKCVVVCVLSFAMLERHAAVYLQSLCRLLKNHVEVESNVGLQVDTGTK